VEIPLKKIELLRDKLLMRALLGRLVHL